MQKDVQFDGPDIVVVQFGTNDSTHWLSNRGAPIVSQAAFRANLEEMVDRCRRFSIPRIIFVTNHKVALERFDINGMTPDQNTAIYDEITRGVAARTTCLVADVRAHCVDIEPQTICQGDLIHVNGNGAKLYADVVSPVMVSVIEGLVALKRPGNKRFTDD
jgi:lysophospholipase L1-like esterase